MKRILTLTAVLCAIAAFAPVTSASAAESCSAANISTPTLSGLVGVYDQMNGKCNTLYSEKLTLQYESAGVWVTFGSVQSSLFFPSTSNSESNVWDTQVIGNCSVNWRGYGEWQDSAGSDITALYSGTLHKTC